MRFIIGADDESPVLRHVQRRLEAAGHEAHMMPVKPWAKAAIEVARAVSERRADFGVVGCWTGTGVTIAANKIDGVRAALCGDAATATGARKWNDANVLTLSLRSVSEAVATEIVDAFVAASYDGSEAESLADLVAAEG